MNIITLRDKVILLAVALAIAVYGGYNLLWLPANENIAKLTQQEAELKSQIGDQTLLSDKIKSLENENNSLVKNITDFKSTQSTKTLDKQDFLVFLGNECDGNSVELIKFNDLSCSEQADGVWKAQFDFELRGTLMGLNNVCMGIENTGVKYSVGGMSLRQNSNFAYLTRFFDSISKLEWYKDETPSPENIPEEIVGEPNEVAPSISENPLFVPVQPQIEMPQTNQVPTPEISPTPKPKDENITDRLDKLLELTANKLNYRVMLLTNTNNFESSNTVEQMRLNITVEFIMYGNPKNSLNSFLNMTSGV